MFGGSSFRPRGPCLNLTAQAEQQLQLPADHTLTLPQGHASLMLNMRLDRLQCSSYRLHVTTDQIGPCSHLHHVEEAVVEDQALGHAQPVGLHGVPGPVVVASDLRIIEVGHLHASWRGEDWNTCMKSETCTGGSSRAGLASDGVLVAQPAGRLVWQLC